MVDPNTTDAGHDFQSLVQRFGLDLNAPRRGVRPQAGANDYTYDGGIAEDVYRVCEDGERTQNLTHLSGRLIRAGLNQRATTDMCLGWNERNHPPLPEDKVVATVRSIFKTHQRNHPADEASDGSLFDLEAASVSRYFDTDPPQRDWVLNDCIPLGKTVLLVAPGGTGKSQFVLQLAVDIATGQQRFSPWAPSRVGQVVIIGAEDEDEEFHRRFRRLTDGSLVEHNAHLAYAALRRNLYVVSRVADDNLLTFDDGSEIRQTGFVERIADAVKPLDNLRLVVIDPVARFRGGEENSAEDTTRFVEAAEKLAQLTGAAVLLVHHANKTSMQGGDQNQAAARGSSALSDGVRLQINLAPINAGEKVSLGLGVEESGLVAKITKTNYSVAGVPIYLRRDDQGRLMPINVKTEQLTRRDALMKRLVEFIADAETQGRHYSKSAFAADYGGRDRQFGIGVARLKKLIDDAIIAGVVETAPGKDKSLRVCRPNAKGQDEGAP